MPAYGSIVLPFLFTTPYKMSSLGPTWTGRSCEDDDSVYKEKIVCALKE